jgi:S-adenosylmethionine decarboxylase
MKTKAIGTHLIADFFGSQNDDSVLYIKKALREAIKKAGATLILIKTHKFYPQGVSAFALIAESHVSIYSWPEFEYMAIDAFSSGRKVNLHKIIEILEKRFKPKKIRVKELKRGLSRFG